MYSADEERSKRDDFQHAKRYYELERDMLLQLEGRKQSEGEGGLHPNIMLIVSSHVDRCW
jgi:hypothetical protein